MPPGSGFTKNYDALDGIRGYAVVLVSLTHFAAAYALSYRALTIEHATYLGLPNPTDKLFLWFYLSMQSLYILLTISGYMVCRMIMRPTYPGYARFILARGARIYPPLLFGLVFAVTIFLLLGYAIDLSARNILYNVLTLNGVFELKGNAYDFPSWSLFYEIVYCLMIPGLVAMARKTRHPTITLCLVWMPILLGLATLGFSGWILFAPFLVGSLLAQFDDRRLAEIANRIPGWAVFLAYFVVAALPSSWAPLPFLDSSGIHFALSYMIFIVLACLMSCALVIKAVFSPGAIQRLFSWRPLVYLGKISYSFYLVHAPLIVVAFAFFAPVFGHLSPPAGVGHFFLVLAAFWVMSLAAAMLGYYAVEMIYFRSAMSSRSKAFAKAHPNAPVAAPQQGDALGSR
jgi:exopolysaccharide production protein ExoZ